MIPAKEILARVESLPTLSVTVARLAVVLQNEHASSAEFEEVIKPDLALTANLLRMANSAFAGVRGELTTVSQALAVMGTVRVFQVAAGAAFAQVIPRNIPGYDLSARGFWLHSSAVAILAETLSPALGNRTPGLTFTAGLLHDIGKLVIGAYLREESAEILARIRRESAELVVAEREVLGTDHAEVGALVAERWELPEFVTTTTRWHHAPSEALAGESGTIVDLVHVADALAHSVGYGTDVGELARGVDPEATGRLGVTAELLEQVACETVDDIRQMEEVFAQQ